MKGHKGTACSHAWILLVTAMVGCTSGAKLRGRVSTVDEVIATARESGAQRCAPVELAMAESHVDFARQELAEGRYHRARAELAIAETQAHEAVRKSPRAVCARPVDTDKDGFVDSADGCPEQAEDRDGFKDEDGCPDSDNDADGLADSEDRCPIEAEDRDGFQDEDGCPDSDNDADGLADPTDACPVEPEDKDGFKDEDGCPDCDDDGDGVPECPQVVDRCPTKAAQTADGCPEYKLVVVTEQKIELKQTIYFAYNKATIRKVSYPLLRDVAQVLKDNIRIRVRIEGHTDNQGGDEFNMRLSQARTEAVREFLTGQGIDAARMEAQGYGETVPIADNGTEAGRAKNRRVEFVIIER